MKSIACVLACVLAVAAVPAGAAEGGKEPGKGECKLHRTDLTDAEFAKAQDEMFGKLDADHSGSISREEFATHHEEMRRKHADHADHAGDAAQSTPAKEQ